MTFCNVLMTVRERQCLDRPGCIVARVRRGLLARAAKFLRTFPVRARNLPLVMALPLATVTLAPDPGGGDADPAQEAQQPPSGQEAQTAPRQVHPEARDAIAMIRSPFCPGQMLEVCPSRDAAILRDSLDQMAGRGLPADSMVELVVAAYGEEYRALPKRSGTGLLAWVVPPAALVVGLGLVVFALRRLKGPAPTGDGEGLTDEERERLAAALAELEEMEEGE